MPSIQVVIGLILIMLFYSLLASIIMELIASFLSLRGKQLERALKNMLSSSDRNEELFEDFIKSPLYLQLSGRAYRKKSAPSYLSSNSFREILFSIIERRKDGIDFVQKIKNLPDQNLKEVLDQFLKESDFNMQAFKAKIEVWYDEVMDRASGWYTRNIQKILLVLGFAIAALFNVDALTIFDNLSNASQSDLEHLAALAEQVSNQQSAVNKEIYQLIEQNLAELENPLGIGWEEFQPTQDVLFWVFKISGWLITAICISKGTPFWFDILNKIVRFRSSGNIPSSTISEKEKEIKVESISSPATHKIDTGEGEIQTLEKPVG